MLSVFSDGSLPGAKDARLLLGTPVSRPPGRESVSS